MLHFHRSWITSVVHRTGSVLGSGLLLLTASAPFHQAAMAEVLVRAQGRCKLTSGEFVSFNGHCTFKHKSAGGRDAYVIHLDDGTEFNFSGPSPEALQVDTYNGIRNVRHTAVGALIGGLIAGNANRNSSSQPARVGAPVPELQSLVGIRGSSAEAEMTRRGYTYRGGDQMGDSAFVFWQQPRSSNCVAVRTSDGRYQAITYTEPKRCQ